MAKVIGAVDLRGRPVIRIEGKQDSILVVVDTGFNGDLMVSRDAAQPTRLDELVLHRYALLRISGR